jgi:hypothetical protein
MAKRPVPKKLAKKLAQIRAQFRIESNGNGESVELQSFAALPRADLTV